MPPYTSRGQGLLIDLASFAAVHNPAINHNRRDRKYTALPGSFCNPFFPEIENGDITLRAGQILHQLDRFFAEWARGGEDFNLFMFGSHV